MLQGIFPVIPTLFTDDNALDLDAQRQVVQFALNVGSHGIVFPGVASEYNFLTPEERGTLIALVAEEADGRIPIVGGASAATAEEVIVAGQQAAASGIHHLMIMAPNGLGKDLDAHRAFFAEIAKALPQAYIPHLKAVFGGGGARYIIDELARGARGAMPAVEFADLHVALWNAHEAEDHEGARELYRLSLPLLVSQTIYRMRFTKYVLSRRKIADAQHVRAPIIELDEFAMRDIDQMLEDLQTAFA